MVVARCFFHLQTDMLFPNWLEFLENHRKDAGHSKVTQKDESKGKSSFSHTYLFIFKDYLTTFH